MSARIFFRGIIIVLLLSSCGSITKMRYSRGYKSNIELFGKKEVTENSTRMPKKAVKRGYNSLKNDSVQIVQNIDTILTKEAFTANFTSGHVSLKLKQNVIKKISPPEPQKTNEKKPIEPHIAAGAIMFYSGTATIHLLLYLTNVFLLPLFAFLLPAGLMLAGLIFSIVGLRKFNSAPEEFRGKGLAISVIVLFILSLISTLALFAIIYLIFIYLF